MQPLWEILTPEQIKVQLDQEAATLAQARTTAKASTDELTALRAAFDAQHQELIVREKAQREQVDALETRLRDGAIALYKQTGDKSYAAFSVRLTPTVDFDASTVVNFLVHNAPKLATELLTVDKKKFEQFVKENANETGALPSWTHIGVLPAIIIQKPAGVITSAKLPNQMIVSSLPLPPSTPLDTLKAAVELEVLTKSDTTFEHVVELVAHQRKPLEEGISEIPCPICKGEGWVPDNPGVTLTGCETCHSSGKIPPTQKVWWVMRTSKGFQEPVELTCAEAIGNPAVSHDQAYATREKADSYCIPF